MTKTMTVGVNPNQHQIEGCRYERRKKHIKEGLWVPTRFRMANVWTWKDSLAYGIIFTIGAIITSQL